VGMYASCIVELPWSVKELPPTSLNERVADRNGVSEPDHGRQTSKGLPVRSAMEGVQFKKLRAAQVPRETSVVSRQHRRQNTHVVSGR